MYRFTPTFVKFYIIVNWTLDNIDDICSDHYQQNEMWWR